VASDTSLELEDEDDESAALVVDKPAPFERLEKVDQTKVPTYPSHHLNLIILIIIIVIIITITTILIILIIHPSAYAFSSHGIFKGFGVCLSVWRVRRLSPSACGVIRCTTRCLTRCVTASASVSSPRAARTTAPTSSHSRPASPSSHLAW
jgi:uncharacterized membrane protein